jgi:hypothetical protein
MPKPLPSWRPGKVRDAILDFVAAVTTKGGPDFVPAAERIAVFDNDGTLWCEQPLQVQVLFTQDRIELMAQADPTMRERQPFKAFLDHDLKAIHALGKQGVFEVAFSVHAGMTVESFIDGAKTWLRTALHPIFHRPFTDTVYRPQCELLEYLREHGFKTFIVSGGGADFIRAFAEEAYGIPPEQVVGSTVKLKFELAADGRVQLMKLPELDTFDDREVKVQNIGLHIGRRPILAFGNSDGDLAMMRYALSGEGRSLALLIHHDDAEREVAYDRDFRLSPLVDALDHAADYGITVVSMKDDWETVFPDPS